MKTKVVKIALLFISVASTLIAITMLDDVVPVHFNAFGEVDRWGSKYELLILPLVLVFIQITEVLTTKFVKKEAEKSTDEKVKNDARSNIKVLDITFCGVSVFFTAMNFFFLYLTFTSMKSPDQISIDSLKIVTVLMGFLFVFLGNIMPKSRKNSMIGLRTLWSEYNDITWRKSNLFGGYAFVCLGLFTVIFSLIFEGIASVIAMLIGLMIITTVMMVYSYKVYKAEKEKCEVSK